MSTGLTINKAQYGTGTTTVDVTGAVSAKVKDGVLNFTVSPSAFNVEDPAPGQLKQVDIVYTINDGSKNEMMKKDNDLVFIDAPPARDASGLQITKAEYGYSGNWTDVTSAVQNLMKSNGSIDIKVGFKELGLPDPNPNKQKELGVEYTINGAQTIANLKDGERFRVSAPPREDDSKHKLGNPVGSIVWAILSGALHFISTFIWVMGALLCYKVGSEYLIGGTIGGILLLIPGLIPFFAFLGMPFLIFAIRLFRQTDILPA
jgi:hypothetical protein